MNKPNMLCFALGGLAWALLAYDADAGPSAPRSVIPRPAIQPFPYSIGHPFPASLARTKTCFVPAGKSGVDDAPNILSAFHECNDGGTVVLDANYTIGTVLDLTFLKSVDVAISGQVSFHDDVDYWTEHAFKIVFQNSSSFLKIGGEDVNIYGSGTINGNGQAWYDRFPDEPNLVRPILLVLDGLRGGSVTGLTMINSPNWFNLIANSSDILVSDVRIDVWSTSDNEPKNTDGWDTFRSSAVVIQHSVINNGDDCVSFKPNSTNMVVQGLSCNGSHGISVGSLGQYMLEYDIVEDIIVYNNTMTNAGDSARIKVWPGLQSDFQPGLNGGGGAGYVKNVTYDKYHSDNVDYIIEVNQCYGQKDKALCEKHPSNMTISDIYFRDFTGSSSDKHDPTVGTLICSSPKQCSNINAQNIDIDTPSGETAEWVCSGFDTSGLGALNCVDE